MARFGRFRRIGRPLPIRPFTPIGRMILTTRIANTAYAVITVQPLLNGAIDDVHLTLSATSSNPEVLTAKLGDDGKTVEAVPVDGAAGAASVTVIATFADGASLSRAEAFEVGAPDPDSIRLVIGAPAPKTAPNPPPVPAAQAPAAPAEPVTGGQGVPAAASPAAG